MDKVDDIFKNSLFEIASENSFTDFKITINEIAKCGYVGLPSQIMIKGFVNGKEEILHLFVKTAPKGDSSRKDLPVRNVFLNEITMYEEVFPVFLQFQKEKGVKDPFECIAKCYKCCKIDKNEFLILEDLSKKGYVLWDKVKPMTIKGMEFVMRECARYHAISFAMRDQKPEVFDNLVKKLSYDAFDIKKWPNVTPVFIKNAQNALKCFDKEKEKHIYQTFENFIQNKLAKILVKVPKEAVIVHGDSWCNNFMFLFDNQEYPDKIKKMKILDWQASRLLSPVNDLSYFFYCNGPLQELDNINLFLKIYHDTLTVNLKEMGTDVDKVFPFSTLKEHWKEYATYGLIMFLFLLVVYHDVKHDEALNIGEEIEGGKSLLQLFDVADIIENEYCRHRIRKIVKHFVDKQYI